MMEEEMIELVAETVWRSLEPAPFVSPIRAAVAYLGTDAPTILPLGVGDVLVVDGSDAALAAGSTNPAAIRRFVEAGAVVVSLAGLHAKVVLEGGPAPRCLVGSANVSAHSRDDLREAAILSDDPALVDQVEAQLDLWVGDPSAVVVDERWLARADRVYAAPRSPRVRREAGRSDTGRPLWLVVVEDDDPPPQGVLDAFDHLRAQHRDVDATFYRTTDDGPVEGVGDSVLLYRSTRSGRHPHGNARPLPLSRVARIVESESGRYCFVTVDTNGTSPSFSDVRRALAEVGTAIEDVVDTVLEGQDREAVLSLLAPSSGQVWVAHECPRCAATMRRVDYGMLPGPFDSTRFEAGGCVSGPRRPTHRCSDCGHEAWRLSFESEAHFETLEDLLEDHESSDLESLAVRVTDTIDHDPVTIQVMADWEDGSPAVIEIFIGSRTAVLQFPFTRSEFWAECEFLYDVMMIEAEEAFADD
ncbi:hypothetical protein JOE63_001664 [Cellulosimicrobium cellulans]|uniref:hypothetical protein n=1 Tax=Cellulosimicrobium cellulans TaxID=1710 RepID=UPI001957D080|nr:hypothetical protein [Cellulosimicrobium cellulans]MBM7819187.1 hypothetical protein [Cellulosimicrobium cellulans]